MSASWVDNVADEDWLTWMKIARRASVARQANSSLGSEDYAAEAVKRLLMQPTRPENVEAWLRTVIRHIYIDRARKISRQGFGHVNNIDNEKIEKEMIIVALGPSSRVIQLDEVHRLLNSLTSKEQHLLILSASGMDNHEIANELGYATNKIVATRIGQITTKLRAEFQNRNNF